MQESGRQNRQTRSKGTALRTGASSGIGAIYADRLARRGHDLILVARHRARLEALATRLTDDTGRSVKVIGADLHNKAELARVAQVQRTDASITVLVNNAGIAMSGDLASADPDHLESMIQRNVLAPSRLARAAIPGCVARGRGTLINISSAAALAPERLHGSDSGTKASLLNLSLRLQQEVAGQGVRVQVVLPGATRTAIWEKADTDIASLPPSIVMNVDAKVDAALVGLDRGEGVTIPSLPDSAEWEASEAARQHMIPKLSRSSPALRYGVTALNPIGAREMPEEINHDRRRFLGPAVMTIGVIGAAVALYALTAMAQSARDIRGPAAVVPLASEPAPKIVIDPPLAEPLAHGRVVIQYRAEHLRIVPVFGPNALDVSPRIGHIHVTVDDARWHWADASGAPLILNGFPVGPHKVLIELANANHQTLDKGVVTFTIPKGIDPGTPH